MHKTAFVVLAALSLSGCASFAPMRALNLAAPVHAKVAVESLADTGEPIVVTDRASQPEALAAMASPALVRRRFGHPTRHQPDLRLLLATAVDRERFIPRRRRRRSLALAR